jgi:hypothetical protein
LALSVPLRGSRRESPVAQFLVVRRLHTMSAPRTIYRSEIGSHLSYPVKFSELCESLSPAMEELGIGVRFSAWNAPRQNESREIYPIIEASYDLREHGDWEIQVSPIPRAIREEVRAFLLPALVAQVRSWLVAKRSDGWRSTYHALRGRFDPASKQLLFHEHNAA